MKHLLIIAVVVFLAGNLTLGAAETKYSGGKKYLQGRWISKSIDGDALFFIVSQIEGRMDKDGKFHGIVSFTDFQTASRIGTYTADDDYVYFHMKDRKKPYKLKYWFTDKKRNMITVKDEKFGVTLTLQKTDKKFSKDSGGLLGDF